MNPAEFVVCGKGCWRNIPFTLVDRGQNVKSPDCNRCVANAWRSEKNADEAVGMTSDTKTERKRATFYWLATALLVPELVLGSIWDVLRVPRVREVIERLGYPTYFLVILGVWKLLGAVALVIPRFPA
jgi:DoxX-like family